MSVIKYCQLISDLVQQGAKGFNAPRLSEWRVTGTGGMTASASLPKIATLGAATLAPLTFGGSIGTIELAMYHSTARLPIIIEGVIGAGAFVEIGWSLPVNFSYGGGEIGSESFLSAGKGFELPSGGIGSLLAGPKANSTVISPNDLVTNSAERFGLPCLTLVSLDSGTKSQYSIAVALFADRPVVKPVDLMYTKAIALVHGMQINVGNGISVGLSGMVYYLSLRNSSLPSPGARHGACVA